MADAMYYIFWELNTNFTKIECLEERHRRKEIEKNRNKKNEFEKTKPKNSKTKKNENKKIEIKICLKL